MTICKCCGSDLSLPRKVFDEWAIIFAYIVKTLELQIGVTMTPKQHSLYIFNQAVSRKNSKNNLLSENQCQNYYIFYQRFNIPARNKSVFNVSKSPWELTLNETCPDPFPLYSDWYSVHTSQHLTQSLANWTNMVQALGLVSPLTFVMTGLLVCDAEWRSISV